MCFKPISFIMYIIPAYTSPIFLVESARVFLGNESMLYNYKEEMHEEPVIENVIFNKDNTLYNVDKFISGESNVLQYILPHSAAQMILVRGHT